MFHEPVLALEVIRYLDCGPDKNYIDATSGTGGHSKLILEATGPSGIVAGFDQDIEACAIARERLAGFKGRFRAVNRNFKDITVALEETGGRLFDGVVFDIGLSSLQLDKGSRGFSFLKEAALDMRMDTNIEITAGTVINEFDEKKIASILYEFGEEKFSRRIASNIVERRKTTPINTTTDLAGIIERSIPKRFWKKGIHPATKSFMAIRIFVNDELSNLKEGLEGSLSVLARNARLAVISYHSLEDRIVKNFLKEKSAGCKCPSGLPYCVCNSKPRLKVITKKPVLPGCEEIGANPRARSAKLRVAEIL